MGRSVAKGSISAVGGVEWLSRLLRSKSACVREKLKFFEMRIAVGDMSAVVNLFGVVELVFVLKFEGLEILDVLFFVGLCAL